MSDEQQETTDAAESSQGTGGHFNLDMTIHEAMDIHPRAREVFAAFHLGGCAHCAIGKVETLGQVCATYGIEPEQLLGVLEDLVNEE